MMRFNEEQRDVRDIYAQVAALNHKLLELQKEIVYINGLWWETYKRLEGIDK